MENLGVLTNVVEENPAHVNIHILLSVEMNSQVEMSGVFAGGKIWIPAATRTGGRGAVRPRCRCSSEHTACRLPAASVLRIIGSLIPCF